MTAQYLRTQAKRMAAAYQPPAADGYIHADCDEPPNSSPIEGPACTVCWLRHPAGECDRD